MRKLSFLLFLFFSVGVRAQWVSIPDTNFGTWLNTNGYSTCLQGNNSVGWQMDTSCPAVVTAYHIGCTNRSIRDLTGISYFDGLRYLYCSSNQLTSLPVLPDSLTTLSCEWNSLTSLPPLPNKLTDLDCYYNHLNSLPSLPDSLKKIQCYQNSLDSLPVLPMGLIWLYCGENNLSSLPALPGGLEDLRCENNRLDSIPDLPQSLRIFGCENNQLTNVPVLPASLRTLNCSDNAISNLPPLPTDLLRLYCYNNQLTSLSDFPDSLYACYIDSNPITCLPYLKRIVTFKFQNTLITCLPNYGNVTTSTPPLNTVPICDVFNTNGCNVYWSITGRVYLDGNGNCVADSSDAGVLNIPLRLWSNNAIIQQVPSLGSGTYSFDADNFGAYTISIDTANFPFDVCPANGLLHDTITVTDSLSYGNDFALQCKSGVDLAAWSVSGARFRPAGFTQADIHLGSSTGFYGVNCAGGVTGSITVVINGPAHYISPAPNALTPTNVSGNVLTYNVPDFGTVDFNNSFNIIVQTNTTATIGDTICFTVTVTTTNTDAAPANNTITICFVVVGSFDPNDKQVYPAADIDPNGDGWLTYTVNFQNTGTDTAIHIYITDTLDSDLDAASFQLLAYSHQPMVQIKENAVRFNFPNIMLVDSNANEPLSHGYVQYKIKLKDNLPIGTQINNTAFIYFDFNAPVVTNTTTNTIAILTSATQPPNPAISGKLLRIYPNPATNQLTINLGGLQAEQVSIYNVDGKLVSQTKQPANNSIDVSHLAKGVYVAEVKVKDAVQRARWVKM